MKFVKSTSLTDAANYIANLINGHIDSNHQVLWLLSGGSAIRVAVEARNLLHEAGLGNLTVSLIDERYGKPGHHDSNWQQLLDMGFKMDKIDEKPVLEGKELDETASNYETMLTKELNAGKFTIGLLGIGPDGHTAGILPGSPAASSLQLTAAYQGPDFQRLTMTPHGIDRLNVAVVYAVGENKRDALLKLSQEIPVSEQPAQALKMVSELIIFNDQVGGE